MRGKHITHNERNMLFVLPRLLLKKNKHCVTSNFWTKKAMNFKE